MLSEESLRRALEAAGVTAPVRWDDVTTSTNTTALVMAARGVPAWTLVAAGHQTGGRGRHGRVWIDRPGRALLCSVVLRPDWPAAAIGLASLAAGVAMAEAASAVSGASVGCKWPNDLLVDGRKVGGILGESELLGDRVTHVVVGAGVNLAPPDDRGDATGLGEDVDAEALLAGYVRRLRSLVEGPVAGITEAWRAVAVTTGRRVEAVSEGGRRVRGTAADIDDAGALLVDTSDGRVRVPFGEIRHLDEAR